MLVESQITCRKQHKSGQILSGIHAIKCLKIRRGIQVVSDVSRFILAIICRMYIMSKCRNNTQIISCVQIRNGMYIVK